MKQNPKPRKPLYTGWEIPESVRNELMAYALKAKYPDVIAHHITDTPPPKMRADTPAPADAEIHVVGVADNGEGVQALIVTVNGQTHSEDGRCYHCTWSIDRSKGFKPVDSNKVIDAGQVVNFPDSKIKFKAPGKVFYG